MVKLEIIILYILSVERFKNRPCTIFCPYLGISTEPNQELGLKCTAQYFNLNYSRSLYGIFK